MKKSLAIIMSLSLVATAAFAQDAAVAATATTAAKTVAAPAATYGFTTAFTARVAKDNASDTFEKGKLNEPVSSFNPLGLKVTAYSVNPWVNLDWSKMSVKAEAAYNAFDANLTDYSKINLTTTWKDFFGVEIKSVVSKDNKGVKDATVATNGKVELGTLSHDVFFTYDKTKENGIKLYTKNSAANFFKIADLGASGSNLQKLFDGFSEIGFALDNSEFAANVVYKQQTIQFDANGNGASDGTDTAIVNRFDTAWFEARKMFNVWTARLNDSTEMALRIKDLDSKVTIGRSGYGIGKGNNFLGGLKKDADLNDAFVDIDGHKVTTAADLVWLRDMNMLNTITPVKNLTVKAALVLPTQSDVPMVDWLAGKNLSLGAEYAIDGIGTIGAGTLISNDYVANGNGTIQGPSLALTPGGVAAAASAAYTAAGGGAPGLAAYTAVMNSNSTTKAAHVTALVAGAFGTPAYSAALTGALTTAMLSYNAWGSAFWLDANLSQMIGKDNSLFVSFNGQLGSYVKGYETQTKWAAQAAAGDTSNARELIMGSVSKYAIGAEVGIKATEALKLSAAAMYRIGMGYDAKAATNVAFSDTKTAAEAVATNYVSSSYTEANVLAYNAYEIRPLELNVRADYTVNKTASIYLSNGFKMNDGDLDAGELGAFTNDGAIDNSITAIADAGARTNLLGFYSKNTIGLGATLAATAKSKLTLSGDYNLYLGVPTASDLYTAAATADEKKVIDASYGTWKSSNFNPFSVKVAYSYAY